MKYFKEIKRMNLIKGKVAKIIDEYTVVLNIGYNDDVEEDMRFIIYDVGEEIKDPDTDVIIGNFEHVKAKIRIMNVAEKISTAVSDETTTIVPAVQSFLSAMGKEELKKLPLNDEMKNKVKNSVPEATIKVGDLVRQILD